MLSNEELLYSIFSPECKGLLLTYLNTNLTMRFLSILPILLIYLLPGFRAFADSPLVQFWQSTVSSIESGLWLTKHDKMAGSVYYLSSTGLQVDSAQFKYDSKQNIWKAAFFEHQEQPVNPWWSATTTFGDDYSHLGYLRFIGTNSNKQKLQIQQHGKITELQLIALQRLVDKTQGIGSLNCHETYRTLHFNDSNYQTIEADLEQFRASRAARAVSDWTSEAKEIDDPAPSRREIAIEFRLMRLTPNHCSVLAITHTFGGGAHGNYDLECFNYQLIDNTWQRMHPLGKVSAPIKLREQIRQALNTQDCDGDYFAKQHPDRECNESILALNVLEFKNSYWIIFEPYHVASFARGIVCVVINKDDSNQFSNSVTVR